MVLIWYLLTGMMLGSVTTISIFVIYKLLIGKMFPIEMPTLMQRGKGFVWDLAERARLVTRKDGTTALKLKKRRKKTIKPPKFEYLSSNLKGKPVFPIFYSAFDEIKPIKIIDTTTLETAADPGSRNWIIQELQRAESKYRSQEGWFAKYGTYILNATLASLIVFIIIYFGGKFEIMSSNLSGAAAKIAEAMEKFSSAPPPPSG